MAYRIEYEHAGTAKRNCGRGIIFKYALWSLGTVAIVTAILWSLGGDWTVTVGALESMAKSLGKGSAWKEAFSDFCLEILQGA